MFNVRVSTLAACSAFILSLCIGILNKSSFPAVILRPVLFGILFFGLPFLITLIINRFLPELLDDSGSSPDIILPGTNINIKEDAAPPGAVPANLYARPDDSEADLGDISDAMNNKYKPAPDFRNVQAAADTSGMSGLDQNVENGYTEPRPGAAGDGGYDILPDLESLAGSFTVSAGDKEEEKYEYQESDVPKRSLTGNKAQKMDVDFSPKDLAAGIRTIIDKQEG